MEHPVRWAQSEGDADEYVGFIQSEPSFKLVASRYRWAVYVDGLLAREILIEPYNLDRARRRQGKAISGLELAQAQASTWVAQVLAKRDAG